MVRPPAELKSSAANVTPCISDKPQGAAPPVNGVSTPIVMTCSLLAVVELEQPVTNPASKVTARSRIRKLHKPFFTSVSPFGVFIS